LKGAAPAFFNRLFERRWRDGGFPAFAPEAARRGFQDSWGTKRRGATMTEVVKKESQEPARTPERTRGGVVYTPRVDIVETENELTLYADLPGVRAEDLDMQFENGELSIYGRVAPRPRSGRHLYGEYGIGDFYRRFTVDDSIDAEKITAELTAGVLAVHLPKSEAVKPRRIQVQAG
jgi:HSP20 family protein